MAAVRGELGWSAGAESERRGRRPTPSRLVGVSEVAGWALLVWGYWWRALWRKLYFLSCGMPIRGYGEEVLFVDRRCHFLDSLQWWVDQKLLRVN